MLYSGVTGKIAIKKGVEPAKDIAHMSNFTVDLSKEIIEVISLGSDAKEKIAGVKDWTASFDGTADFAATSGQKDLLDAYNDGSVLEASFYLDADTFLMGNCLIESLSISSAADGKAEISISLSGTGSPTLTAPVA